MNETIKYLTSKELEKLFKCISSDDSKYRLRNLCLFKIAFYCGLRASEIGLIYVSDFNKNTRELYCKRLKGSNNNTIRLDKETARLISSYIRDNNLNNDDLLFASQHHKAISRKTIDVLMKKYAVAAKIKDTTKHHFHVLKHTRAVSMLENNFTLEDIQYVLGHKNIANTSIYAQFSSNYKKNLFDKMDSMLY